MSNKNVANVLFDTLARAGWIDDADELLGDLYDNVGHAGTVQYIEQLKDCVKFIKKNLPATTADGNRHYNIGDLGKLDKIFAEFVEAEGL